MKEYISWIVSIVSKIVSVFNPDKNKNVHMIKIKKLEHNYHTTIINGDCLSKDQLTGRCLKKQEADKKNETEI